MFSVIIPTFNRYKYALRAVQSALSSNHIVEIIVIDTNDVSSLIFVNDLYKLSEFIVYKFVGRVNGSIARNVGVGLATMDWLMFLDDDDVFMNFKYDVIKKEIFKISNSSVFVSSSRVENTFYRSTSRIFKNDYLSLFEHIIDDNKFNSSSLVIKRNLYFELGGFDERLVRKQDFDFLLRVLITTRVKVINSELQILDKGDRQNLPNIKLFLKNQFYLLYKYIFRSSKSIYIFPLLCSEFLTSFFFLALKKKSVRGICFALFLNAIIFFNLPFLILTMFNKINRYFLNKSCKNTRS
jgi:glycosyltransferase involved in cell wall biosynthesis